LKEYLKVESWRVQSLDFLAALNVEESLKRQLRGWLKSGVKSAERLVEERWW